MEYLQMKYLHRAYRVDWPAEVSVGRTRFYGVDDEHRMRMHLEHAGDMEPKVVPLYEKQEIKSQPLFIDYTNYRNDRAWRLIDCAGSKIRFGTSQYHTEPQWLMTAFDVLKGAEREFAIKDIHEAKTAVLEGGVYRIVEVTKGQ